MKTKSIVNKLLASLLLASAGIPGLAHANNNIAPNISVNNIDNFGKVHISENNFQEGNFNYFRFEAAENTQQPDIDVTITDSGFTANWQDNRFWIGGVGLHTTKQNKIIDYSIRDDSEKLGRVFLAGQLNASDTQSIHDTTSFAIVESHPREFPLDYYGCHEPEEFQSITGAEYTVYRCTNNIVDYVSLRNNGNDKIIEQGSIHLYEHIKKWSEYPSENVSFDSISMNLASWEADADAVTVDINIKEVGQVAGTQYQLEGFSLTNLNYFRFQDNQDKLVVKSFQGTQDESDGFEAFWKSHTGVWLGGIGQQTSDPNTIISYEGFIDTTHNHSHRIALEGHNNLAVDGRDSDYNNIISFQIVESYKAGFNSENGTLGFYGCEDKGELLSNETQYDVYHCTGGKGLEFVSVRSNSIGFGSATNPVIGQINLKDHFDKWSEVADHTPTFAGIQMGFVGKSSEGRAAMDVKIESVHNNGIEDSNLISVLPSVLTQEEDTFQGRQYILKKPDIIEKNQLYLVLHDNAGDRYSADTLIGKTLDLSDNNQGLNQLASEQGFVVAYAQASVQQTGQFGWDYTADVEYLSDLADHLTETHGLDPRINVIGFSEGGSMALALACHRRAGIGVNTVASIGGFTPREYTVSGSENFQNMKSDNFGKDHYKSGLNCINGLKTNGYHRQEGRIAVLSFIGENDPLLEDDEYFATHLATWQAIATYRYGYFRSIFGYRWIPSWQSEQSEQIVFQGAYFYDEENPNSISLSPNASVVIASANANSGHGVALIHINNAGSEWPTHDQHGINVQNIIVNTANRDQSGGLAPRDWGFRKSIAGW